MSTVLCRRGATTTVMFGLAVCALLSMPIHTAKAQSMKPIQNPITGAEDLGDLSHPQQALAQFYRAFNSRDLKMIDENFARTDEVAIDNPLGGIRRGADEPHRMYEGVFRRMFTWNFGTIRFTAPATYFGLWGESAARTVMAKP